MAVPTLRTLGRAWVADDYVELHFASKNLGDPRLDVVSVDEWIGVGLEARSTVERFLVSSAMPTIATDPGVLTSLEPDVAVPSLAPPERLYDRMFATGIL